MKKLLRSGGAMLAGLATLVALAGFGGPGIPNPHINIYHPEHRERWEIGRVHQIEWDAVEVIGPYRIELQRRPGMRWETIVRSTEGQFKDNGHLVYNWRATGPGTMQAKIKITAIEWPWHEGPITAESNEFIIAPRGLKNSGGFR